MNIVIVGDGKVGYTITERLSREDHDITVIDKRPAALNNTMNLQDVSCIEGNGVSHVVQTEAGVPKADLLIAATSADEMNMLCCMVAKKLGAKHTIARVRKHELADEINMFSEDMGLSMTVNPERYAAQEIFSLLRFTCAFLP